MADNWLEDRTGIGALRRRLAARLTRPAPNRSWSAALGSVVVFLLLNQLATGALLAIYYTPTWEGAHGSVEDVVHGVPLGWWIRGMHVWGAHLLVAVVLLHLVRTFVHGAHRAPRELTWVTGALLLAVILKTAFTGTALPMDQEGYSGMVIGTGLANEIPLLGEMVVGGPRADEATLKRFFAYHALWLPMLAAILVVLHVALVCRHGLTPRGEPATRNPDPTLPARSTLAVLCALALLVTLSVLAPPGVGEKADPMGPTPEGVRPPWFFLPAYQALKFTPSWSEPILMTLAFLALLLAPWWARGKAGTVVFVAGLAGAVALGVWGALG